jgi:ABC-2 type transport system ATP-binding protein
MSHEVIIETRNLTRVYRDFWGRPKVQALKALDLQVHRGEIFGLLGPKAAERTKRVSRLIDMVGLTNAKHRQLREYSKGMQRRIGLAQALINNPELILLDEPTSGLDPIGTSEIKHLIRELREQGKTIVLSGHLLADMQDICDRIAILHRGELKEIGRVSDLLTVQDVTQIKARNLGPAAIEEIRDVIHRCGGRDVTVDHPTTTLEELFLRIVQESDLHPGRRKVAHDMARQKAPVEDELAGTSSKS